MNAQEIIERIRTAEKKTPSGSFSRKDPLDFPTPRSPAGRARSSSGLGRTLPRPPRPTPGTIDQLVVESDSRNSAIPLLDTKDLKARIEPGASSATRWRSAMARLS